MDSLQQLAEERDRLRQEERKILDEVRETRSKIATVRTELQTLRKTRDELNETVKALKMSRDQLRDSAKRSLANLRTFGRLGRESGEGSRAEREMAQLEWKVQTSPLEKEEERRLMEKIRVLESRVGAHRKTQRLSSDISRSRTEADQLHAKIQELAAESQTYHLDIVQLGDRFQQLRTKLEAQNKALDEARRRVAEVSRKYVVLRDRTREEDRIAQLSKQKAFKETLKETAKEKLSQRGKVSLEELGALYGDEE